MSDNLWWTRIEYIGLSTAVDVKTREITGILKHDISSAVGLFSASRAARGFGRCGENEGLGLRLDLVSVLLVAASYEPQVLRTSLIFYILNADSDR